MYSDRFLTGVGKQGFICTVTYVQGDDHRNRFECVTQNDDAHFHELPHRKAKAGCKHRFATGT